MSNSFEIEHDAPEYSTVATLAQNVVLHVQGCTDIEIRKALQTAYADFCRLSSCLNHESIIELEPSESRYPVVAMTPGCFVDSVTEVRYRSRKLTPGRDYRVLNVGGVVMIELGEHVTPDAPTTEQIAARPELTSSQQTPDTITVTSIDLPRMGSEKAPRWFFDKYGEAVVSGALIKLFGMSGKSWTDGVRAQHELIRWENYLTEARLRSVYSDERSMSGGGSLSALDTSGLL